MGKLTLIIGGAKSGKTSYGLRRCEEHPPKRIYLATAQAWDEEMADRIQKHKAERGVDWKTVEEPFDPAAVFGTLKPEDGSVVLLDCLTLWLSNLMAGRGYDVARTTRKVKELAAAIKESPCPVYIVSNEVGHGIVPDNKLAREYRDASGVAHQILAQEAEDVFLVIAGLPQKLK